MKRTTARLIISLALCQATGLAQTETGLITGAITDPSGAFVVGAKVAVRSLDTQATRSAVTTASGLYTVPNLQPGNYEVVVEAEGFARFTQQAEVTVGSRNSVNASLVVGAEKTSVEVRGKGGVQVETQTQTLSEVVTGIQVTELPTLTRNPYDLVQVSGNISPEDPTGRGVGVAINGQRAASTNVQLDGAENMDEYGAFVGQSVPLDAVQEFRLLVNNFTAEYGRASGGIVNVATKTGTNTLHGTIYEFNRVSAVAANTFDDNSRGLRKGVFTRNQFGYSSGGPILKDKLFFFQSTEWTRVRSYQTVTDLVPTPELIAAATPATQNFFTAFGHLVAPIKGPVFTKADILASGVFPRPSGSFNALPVATPMFGLVSFSIPSDAGGGPPQASYSLVARVDYSLSQRTSLYGRYALQGSNLFPGTISFSPYQGYNTGQTRFNNSVLLSLTHVFSPTLVSQSKFVFNRLIMTDPLGSAPVGPALFGPGAILGHDITLPGYQGVIRFGGPENLAQAYHDVSYSRGNHLYRAGGQYIYSRENLILGRFEYAAEVLGPTVSRGLDGFLNGTVTFFATAIDPQGKFPCVTRLDGTLIRRPDCMLTLPVRPPDFSRSDRFHDLAAYVQDSWRASPGLTLNLGLRWEYYGVQHNKNPDLDSNFYLGPGSNIFAQIRSGHVLMVPDSPVKSLYQPQYGDFGPRLGFAWDVLGNGKTSLRGGYGVGYERNFGENNFNILQNPPHYAVVELRAGVDVPHLNVTTDNAGPLAGSGFSSPLPVVKIVPIKQDIKTAYAHFWSLGVDRELLTSTVLSLAYSGSRGVNLYSIEDLNRVGSGVLYGGDDPAINRFSRVNRQYARMNFRGNNAFSSYSALYVALKSNRLARTGLTMTTSYTWSRAVDNLSSTGSESGNDLNLGLTDPLNPELDRGYADFDIRQRFVFSGIWESPLFREFSHRTWKQVLAGWSLAPIFAARSGAPFTIFDCSNAFEVCPRYIPSAPVSTDAQKPTPTNQSNLFRYLTLPPAVPYVNPVVGISDFGDCTLVAAPPCPYPANMTRRNAFRRPGSWNLNLGIYKAVRLSRFTLQFRTELFDAFNHANFVVVDSIADIAQSPGLIVARKNDDHRNVQFALKLIF